MADPNCCFMIIAGTFFFLQPIAEGNCGIEANILNQKCSLQKWQTKKNMAYDRRNITYLEFGMSQTSTGAYIALAPAYFKKRLLAPAIFGHFSTVGTKNTSAVFLVGTNCRC